MSSPDDIADEIADNLEQWKRIWCDLKGDDIAPAIKRAEKYDDQAALDFILCFPRKEVSALEDWLQWHKPAMGASLAAKRKDAESTLEELRRAFVAERISATSRVPHEHSNSEVVILLLLDIARSRVEGLIRTLRHIAYLIRGDVVDAGREGVTTPNENTPVTLREFMEQFCTPKLTKNLLDRRLRSLRYFEKKGTLRLPDHEIWRNGQAFKYRPDALIKQWPKLQEVLSDLPDLKRRTTEKP